MRCTRDFLDGALAGFVFGCAWILLSWRRRAAFGGGRLGGLPGGLVTARLAHCLLGG